LIDQIKMLFRKQELQRTLNSLEVVARGAALQCAMLTPNFSVQPFKLNDFNALPISVTYKFADSGQ
jgi:heat shock protein 4